jgi:TPR repeat protein
LLAKRNPSELRKGQLPEHEGFENNSAKAQMYFGYAYLYGEGIAVDYDKAKSFP